MPHPQPAATLRGPPRPAPTLPQLKVYAAYQHHVLTKNNDLGAAGVSTKCINLMTVLYNHAIEATKAGRKTVDLSSMWDKDIETNTALIIFIDNHQKYAREWHQWLASSKAGGGGRAAAAAASSSGAASSRGGT